MTTPETFTSIMSFETWLLFFVTETLLSLSPGPAVFYVVSQGLRSAARARVAAAGVISANAVYFGLSATSLGVLIASSASFFTVVKWAGAAYLLWLAWGAWRSAPSAEDVDVHDAAAPASTRRIFLGAVTLQWANPKSLLFFLALLPQFIDPARPVLPQMLVLAATSMIPEFIILCGYGALAARAGRVLVGRQLSRWLARAEGAGLACCAALVATIKRVA